MAEYKVRLPVRTAKQREIAVHPARRKVINAGRRAGKTTLAADLAISAFFDGKRVLYAAPTQEQTDAFWEYIKTWCAEPIRSGYVKKNEQRRTIAFDYEDVDIDDGSIPAGARIKCKTAWDADTMRGDYADDLILDEWAMMDEDAWAKVGAPMLLDNPGSVALFMSTPRRRNHHYKFFLRGMQDGERWMAWSFTSHDNPHLDSDELTDLTEDMTDQDYRQEILAEFLPGEGQVFRNIEACTQAQPTFPAAHAGHRVVIGCDWGKVQDPSAWSVLCVDCGREVALYRERGRAYISQLDDLARIVKEWNVCGGYAESNSMEMVIEEIGKRGLPLTPFATTAKTKPQIIGSLQLALERGEYQWLNDQDARRELEAYEVKYSRHGRPTYSAPSGIHDDTVIARALALRSAHDHSQPVYGGSIEIGGENAW